MFKRKLDIAVATTIAWIDSFWWLGPVVAFMLWMMSGVCYIGMNIDIGTYSHVNWVLGVLGNFYLGIIMLAVSGPFLLKWLPSKGTKTIFPFALFQFIIYLIVVYRSDMGVLWPNYPHSYVDIAILVLSAVITLIVGTREVRR